MKRALVVLATLAAALVAVTSSSPVGAAQTCTGPGSGDSAPVSPIDSAKADLDGDNVDDDLYLSGFGFTLTATVILSNGFSATLNLITGNASGATIPVVRDVDKDGDDEVFVNPVDFFPGSTLDLLVFAGCSLVDASDLSGGPRLRTGESTFIGRAGVDCLAPSAAGRGITQYSADSLASSAFGQGASLDHHRREYRLRVDDATGAVTWTKTLDQTITGDRDGDPAFPELVPPAEEAYRYGRFLFSCPAPVQCAGQTVDIMGTPYDDVIVGTGLPNVIHGRAGSDEIAGKGGADTICAGSGADEVRGGAGPDTILGQKGADMILGNGGADTIKGNGGADTIKGNGGADTISGGKKADNIKGNGGDDILNGNGGPDTLNGGKGTDTCDGGSGGNTLVACEL